MSYFSDLDLRLRQAGIFPERVKCPPCDDCGGETQIIGYERGRITFACRVATCVTRALQASGVSR